MLTDELQYVKYNQD